MECLARPEALAGRPSCCKALCLEGNVGWGQEKQPGLLPLRSKSLQQLSLFFSSLFMWILSSGSGRTTSGKTVVGADTAQWLVGSDRREEEEAHPPAVVELGFKKAG